MLKTIHIGFELCIMRSLEIWLYGVILQYLHFFCEYGTHSIGTIKCDVGTILFFIYILI